MHLTPRDLLALRLEEPDDVRRLRKAVERLVDQHACELSYPSGSVPQPGAPPLVRMNRHGHLSVEFYIGGAEQLRAVMLAVSDALRTIDPT